MDDKLRSAGYKRYLEPESEETIPSSSWFRYKKLCKEQQEKLDGTFEDENNEDIFYDAHDIPLEDLRTKIDNFDLHEPSMPISTEENNSENIEILSTQENYFESCINDAHSVIKSLAVDLDVIENYVEKCAQIEEDDDFFLDTFDDQEILENENTEEDENVQDPSKTVFTSLDDMLNSEGFNSSMKKSINRSVGEIIIMIIKYALVHALSLTAIYDLFNLINCIFDENILPASKYLIDKLFCPRSCVYLHAMCTQCGGYIGQFKRMDHFINCSFCKAKINVKDSSYKDFFVMLNVSDPISKLIESNSNYYKYVINDRVHVKGQIHDIYDGKRYRDFVKQLSENDKKRYATVTFNTDGAPLFESSTNSIWPIYLMVNELPNDIRTKELILVGLWFGKDKPNMQAFLQPFVETMNVLSTTGVQCLIDGVQIFIKIFAIICCVDSVARAPVQGFTQFNGAYGCNQCLHPGKRVLNNENNPRSGNIKYPLLNKVPKERNAEDTVKHMRKATSTKKPYLGVKNVSHLINLMYFNIIFGCVPDSMHCVSGVAKQFATMLFGNKKKAGILPKKHVVEIDALLKNIKAPHQIGRLTRSFSEKEFWKSREWENWVLFYSLPILQHFLPTELLAHWALFVEAIYLLLKGNIQTREVDRADRLLHEFVARTEALYSKVAMTFNVHLLLHLARSVYDWGPLWSHNAFAFESGNGDLLKVVHAAKGVHNQICRSISLKYTMQILKERVNPCSSVKLFLLQTGTNMVQKTLKTVEHRYFGPTSNVSQFWVDKLQLSSEKALSYNKLVKNRCLYVSFRKENKRSNNTFAQLRNGEYVKLKCFIVDSETNKEYTIVEYVHTIDGFLNQCNMMRKIVTIDKEESTVLTNEIQQICVHMRLTKNEYVCAVPNLNFY